MKILNIYNNAPLYREGIFTLIDKELDCDWFFGDALHGIKQMDTSKLKGKVIHGKNISLFGNHAYWQTGAVKLLFNKHYTHFVILGEERCLSTWCFLLLSVFFPKKKIYFWSHGAYGREGKIKILIMRFFWSFIDGAFLYGHYAKNIMKKENFDISNCHIIHNSLNYEKQMRLRESISKSSVYIDYFGNNDPVLVMIGRLNLRKKLNMLIHAVAILREKGETYNVVLIGDGEDRKHVEELVSELKIKKQVWFYGACYNEAKNAELLYNSDMCVVPGDIGLTAIHSMMFGVPCITHNNYSTQGPEFEAIQEGITGSFFVHNDIKSLADTISNWFRQKRNCREEVRQACYHEIDTQWNPKFQIEVFKRMIK